MLIGHGQSPLEVPPEVVAKKAPAKAKKAPAPCIGRCPFPILEPRFGHSFPAGTSDFLCWEVRGIDNCCQFWLTGRPFGSQDAASNQFVVSRIVLSYALCLVIKRASRNTSALLPGGTSVEEQEPERR